MFNDQAPSEDYYTAPSVAECLNPGDFDCLGCKNCTVETWSRAPAAEAEQFTDYCPFDEELTCRLPGECGSICLRYGGE
jgi:hypothetical protein